ncbi:MAG: hypothetical protein Q8R37_00330 [Nanoarchaeota archaeon]|nr:hypothetical protein [Nanoarchaeota archaeon]
MTAYIRKEISELEASLIETKVEVIGKIFSRPKRRMHLFRRHSYHYFLGKLTAVKQNLLTVSDDVYIVGTIGHLYFNNKNERICEKAFELQHLVLIKGSYKRIYYHKYPDEGYLNIDRVEFFDYGNQGNLSLLSLPNSNGLLSITEEGNLSLNKK